MPESNYKIPSRGFTLIELLVVITIIGILAVVLIPNMIGMRQRARDSSLKQQLTHLKDALRLYYNDYQTYPDTGVGNVMNGCGTDHVSACSGGSPFTAAGTTYLQELPETFFYEQSISGDGFIVWVQLENKSDQDIADSAAKCGKTPVVGETFYYACSF